VFDNSVRIILLAYNASYLCQTSASTQQRGAIYYG
jgi:hypothetical protein